MPRYIDSVFIFQQSEEADKILINLSDWFKRNNIRFSPNSNVVFNDFGDDEREPEFLSSEDEAIRSILSWPALGGMEYNFSGYTLSVFLFGITDYHADALTISLGANSYLKDPHIQKDFDELITQIHQLLQTKRTVSDYELLSPNSFWIEELRRVRSNIFEGKYLLDLRQKA